MLSTFEKKSTFWNLCVLFLDIAHRAKNANFDELLRISMAVAGVTLLSHVQLAQTTRPLDKVIINLSEPTSPASGQVYPIRN